MEDMKKPESDALSGETNSKPLAGQDLGTDAPLGGGNRTRGPVSATALSRNDLQHDVCAQSVPQSASPPTCPLCHALARPDIAGHADSLLRVAVRWDRLPPHIRDAVVTLVAAADISFNDSTCRGGAE